MKTQSTGLFRGNPPKRVYDAQPLEKRNLKKCNIAFYELQISIQQGQIKVSERRLAKGLETAQQSEKNIAYFNEKIADIRTTLDQGWHMGNNATDRQHKKAIAEAQPA